MRQGRHQAGLRQIIAIARDLTACVGRTPTLHGKIDSAAVADREVARGAGAGRIP